MERFSKRQSPRIGSMVEVEEEREIALVTTWKLSNLMLHDSVSLLGLEDQLECIDSKLREIVHLGHLNWSKSLKEIAYDIEEVVDVLVIKASQKIGAGILMRCVLAFTDLIEKYKLCRKLEHIKVDLFELRKLYFSRFAWWRLSKKDLDVGETVISPVIRRVTSIISDGDVTPAVKKQARWLRDEFISLHGFLKAIEVNGLTEGGEAWMEEVYDALRLAEDAIGLFLYEREKLRRTWTGPLKNLALALRKFLSERKLGKEMHKIKAKIQDISVRKLSAIQRRPMRVPIDIVRPMRVPIDIVRPTPYNSFNVDEQPDIPIFDDDIDDIMEMLLRDDPNCLTISIVGMRGIGKTSLAKLIFENHAIINHFPYRVWVPSASMDSLLEQIAREEYEMMAVKYKKRTSTSMDRNDFLYRSRQILNASLKSKKYLIVIDDECRESLWNELGVAVGDLSNGTRILFTARKVGLTPQLSDRNFTYRLQLRSDDESWALFTHSLNKDIPLELLKLRREILRRCGGLPLMIKELAGLLSNKAATTEEWSRVLEQLNQNEGPWYEILYGINRHLPLYLRRCLFYFVLFPEDFEVPARRLIGLWVAEGLGRQKGDQEPPECVSEKCLIELVNQNMIQVTKKKMNGKISRCRLPDALRVHWLPKAREANFLQDNMGINLSMNNTSLIRRLADHLDHKDASFDHIHGNRISSSVYSSYRNVVSFLSFDTQEGSRAGEDVENFLERCISSGSFYFLWVLDLENVYKPKLPKAVGQLTRLRYLGLRSTYMETLPVFIDKLLNLQSLDLKRTCINTVPNSIWKMQNLRQLFLDESFCIMFVPQQEDSSLVDLQTLWGALVDETSPVRNGLGRLSKLTKLGLKCKSSVSSQNEAMSSQLVAVANWVTKMKHLQYLRLKSFDESGLPWDLYLESLLDHKDLCSLYLVGRLKNQHLVSEFPSNLIELTLSASEIAKDPMQTLDKLPNLRILKLLSRSFTGKKMLSRSDGFAKLEILKFWELEALEEWNVEEGALCSLKDLEIRSCRNLKMLPDGLKLIRTLRELKLTRQPELSARIRDNQGEDWNKISHARHIYIED
ncbi:probable disease resistance protein At1g58602 [Manihot esculenta]|uniref:Uncharacterized protein n=1 Tax=Manihot esculenta TaxID=3983 RepID=A0A251L0U2_MANES|nr:probable disease resistance protein At1g58602 [Manihot esculenta]XP_021610825.1 probable disease resistance protein At1g58602 [Manihot esculenta]XP_043811878.1 probable disease resistance protein At1g58602 [Manihot esculenta]OAY51870.1 hypothetical protein MANES_04G039700v8 [Manihot esculenta]